MWNLFWKNLTNFVNVDLPLDVFAEIFLIDFDRKIHLFLVFWFLLKKYSSRLSTFYTNFAKCLESLTIVIECAFHDCQAFKRLITNHAHYEMQIPGCTSGYFYLSTCTSGYLQHMKSKICLYKCIFLESLEHVIEIASGPHPVSPYPTAAMVSSGSSATRSAHFRAHSSCWCW